MTAPVLDELRARFNAAAGSVRIIAFLSPTCGPCRYGQGVVRAAFDACPAASLRAYIVWVPMLEGDNLEAAAREQALIADPRIECWYDAGKAAARAWADAFGLHGFAWDVYAIYGPSQVWLEATPPEPALFMHQLDFEPGVKRADRLDPGRFAACLAKFLEDPVLAPAALAAAMHEAGVRCAAR